MGTFLLRTGGDISIAVQQADYARVPYPYGDIQSQTVFDRAGDHYLLVNVGWDDGRVHGCLVHIDLIG